MITCVNRDLRLDLSVACIAISPELLMSGVDNETAPAALNAVIPGPDRNEVRLMNDHPSVAPPVPGDPLTALAAEYPEWHLHPAPPGVAAEHTSANGRRIRYIAARRVGELAAKLATAEAAT